MLIYVWSSLSTVFVAPWLRRPRQSLGHNVSEGWQIQKMKTTLLVSANAVSDNRAAHTDRDTIKLKQTVARSGRT